MPKNSLLGWEYIYSKCKDDFKEKVDVIVAIAHTCMIYSYKFNCLGIGCKKSLQDNEEDNAIECLPDGWNKDSPDFCLRYVYANVVYVLTARVKDDKMKLQLLHGKDYNSEESDEKPGLRTVSFGIDMVKATQGRLEEMVPEYKIVVSKLGKINVRMQDAPNYSDCFNVSSESSSAPGSPSSVEVYNSDYLRYKKKKISFIIYLLFEKTIKK